MNIVQLFTHLPVFAVVTFVLSQGVPYVTALINRRKDSWWYGATSFLLNLVISFIAELAHVASNDQTSFNWGQLLGLAFTAWVASLAHQIGILGKTKLESDLLGSGRVAVPAARSARVRDAGVTAVGVVVLVAAILLIIVLAIWLSRHG